MPATPAMTATTIPMTTGAWTELVVSVPVEELELPADAVEDAEMLRVVALWNDEVRELVTVTTGTEVPSAAGF